MFAIQASRPRTLSCFEPDDETLSDAIETVFPLKAELALLVWNGVYIPLDYKYDVSCLISDTIDLLSNILDHAKGTREVNWFSSSFTTTWNLSWEGGRLRIQSRWIVVTGGTEPLLNERNTIECDREAFLAEWKMLLIVVHEGLLRAGYAPNVLAGLGELERVISRIGGEGTFYGAEV